MSNYVESIRSGTVIATSYMDSWTATHLNILACTETSAKEKSKCPVFDSLEVLELSLLSSIPLNQFDEWLLWTQEGKMWRFPIDNEQDWEELSVPFHEHTFLEKHLDKELLKCGPLSIFLELVCHGLAQNPHFTVEQKREHLKWYSSYFKDKVPAIEASVEEEKRLTELERKARGCGLLGCTTGIKCTGHGMERTDVHDKVSSVVDLIATNPQSVGKNQRPWGIPLESSHPLDGKRAAFGATFIAC
ncbi:28S ribosomal protein S31 mitochondrial [Clonorchis sinensis]|uniref:Small ribosomal subunit protein mS31 n=1 Tax=Clonorchis sinensis TaxID=79923 RepID=G7YPT3_CLOSI|nr:28S ribosomal protein S31 mitochondrial [Clonorchis sinensis]